MQIESDELMTAPKQEYVYFSQADAQIHSYLGAKQFRRDLILRLLLEPGLVIPDIFFYISDRIRDEVVSPRSWIAAGIEHGCVIPAFRQRGLDFVSARDEILRQEIDGVISDSRRVAEHLAGLDVPKRIYWPDAVGNGYHGELERRLLNDPDTLSSAKPAEQAVWRNSKELRERSYEFAVRRSPGLTEHGIRRGDLLRGLAETIEFAGDATDTKALLAAVPTHRRNLYVATSLWINEIYHLNQANMFSASKLQVDSSRPNRGANSGVAIRPSFPTIRRSGAGLLRREVLAERSAVSAHSIPPDGHAIRVDWPTMRLLQRIPMRNIMQARTDYGNKYRARLAAFRDDPSSEKWSTVEQALREYSADMCRLASGEPRGQLHVKLEAVSKSIGQASATVGPLLAIPNPTVSYVSAAAGFTLSTAASFIQVAPPVEKRGFAWSGVGDLQVDAPALATSLLRRVIRG